MIECYRNDKLDPKINIHSEYFSTWIVLSFTITAVFSVSVALYSLFDTLSCCYWHLTNSPCQPIKWQLMARRAGAGWCRKMGRWAAVIGQISNLIFLSHSKLYHWTHATTYSNNCRLPIHRAKCVIQSWRCKMYQKVFSEKQCHFLLAFYVQQNFHQFTVWPDMTHPALSDVFVPAGRW